MLPYYVTASIVIHNKIVQFKKNLFMEVDGISFQHI